MAGQYRGLTIQIGGDVLPLKRAIEDANSSVRVLTSEARKLEKEFQFNPDLSNIQKIRDNYSAAIKEATELSSAAQAKLDDLLAKGADESDRNVKRLKTTINNAQKDIAVFNLETAKLDRLEAAGIKKAFEDTSKQVDIAKDKVDALRDKIEAKFTRNTLKELQESSHAAIDKTNEKISVLKNVMAEMEKSDPAAVQTAAFKELENQVIKLETELISVEKNLKDIGSVNLTWLGETFQKAGEGVEKLGKSLLPLSAAATAGLTLATKAAIDQESAFAGVRKTVEMTEAEYAALKDQLIDLSEVIPVSATELMGIAESAGQLGIEKENILNFTRVMADLGVATNLTGEEASSTLAKFANITKMPQENFSRLGSTIVALGNNSATTEKGIASMSMNIAAAGKQAGMSEAQILGFATLLSSVGLEAEAGGTTMSKAIKEIVLAVETGEGKLEDFASVAGMTSAQFQQAFRDDAASALFEFVRGLARIKEEGGSAIVILDEMGLTESRLNDTLLRSSSAADLFAEIMRTANQAWEENTALTKEAEERYATTESQLTMTKNALENTVASIGEKLIPYLSMGAEKVKDFAGWLDSLGDSTKEMIVQVGLFAAATGPLLVGIGNVTQSIGTLFTLMRNHPIGALITVFATLMIHLDELSQKNNKLYDSVKKVNDELKKSNESYEDNLEAIKNVADQHKEEIDDLEDLIKQYGDLNEEVKDNQDNTEILNDKKAALYNIVAQIQRILPDLVFEIDKETGAYINQTTALYNLAAAKKKAYEEETKHEEARAARTAYNNFLQQYDEKELQKQIDDAIADYNRSTSKQIKPEDYAGFGNLAQMVKDLKFWEEGSTTDVQKKAKTIEMAVKNADDAAKLEKKLKADAETKELAYFSSDSEPPTVEDPQDEAEKERQERIAKGNAQSAKKYSESVEKAFADYYKNPTVDAAVKVFSTKGYSTDEQLKKQAELHKEELARIDNQAQKEIIAAEDNAAKIKSIQEKAAKDKYEIDMAYMKKGSAEAFNAETNHLKTIENLKKQSSSSNSGSGSSKSSGASTSRSSPASSTKKEESESEKRVKEYNELKKRLELEYDLLEDEEKDKKAHYDALLALQQEYLEEGSNEWLRAQKELNSLKKDIEKENLNSYKQSISDMKFESEFNVKVNGADQVEEYKKQADEIAENRRKFLAEGTKEYAESLIEEADLRKKYNEEVKASYASDIADLDKKLSDGIISWEEYYRRITELKKNYERGYEDDPSKNPVDLSGLDAHANEQVAKQRRTDIEANYNNYDFTQDLTGKSTEKERLQQKNIDLTNLLNDMEQYYRETPEAYKELLTEIANTNSDLFNVTVAEIENAFNTWDFAADLSGEGTIKERTEQRKEAYETLLTDMGDYFETDTDALKQILTMIANDTEKLNEIVFSDLKSQFDNNEITFDEFKDQYLEKVRELYGETGKEMEDAQDELNKIRIEDYDKLCKELKWMYDNDFISYTEYLAALEDAANEYLVKNSDKWKTEMQNVYSMRREYEQKMLAEEQKAAEQAEKARADAEKTERARLEKERKEKVDQLAKEKEAELKAAQAAQKQAAESAIAAEKARVNAEKERLNAEKAILQETIKGIDEEIKKRRELSQERSKQESIENLQKQLAAADAAYQYARLDLNGDDFDRENKRLEVERLKEELNRAKKEAEEEAIIKQLEENKTALQDQVQSTEDQIRELDSNLSESLNNINTSNSEFYSDVKQMAQEWAESQVPPLSEEEVKNAIIEALGATAGSSSGGAGGGGEDWVGGGYLYKNEFGDWQTAKNKYDDIYASEQRFFSGIKELQNRLQSGEASSLDKARAAQLERNLNITINGAQMNEQQMAAVATKAGKDLLRSEGLM